ncbi:EamA family transporter [Myroides sp. 1354]|uniref:EamA family transporter n=1 Tax=unclassified Myroides TaxID=2642485 RepID=UPI0025769355|nr:MULTISPECIES: EamA family transporter [unclassified Myroides]MDM1045761.1 EamA family transporter [Myroides sp. R163-1]MDM1056763.1 EamA family transporter [Myroides sp. 1354]MDM1070556.1 EamA family transporter [Myroides sp. 1372]
MKAIATNQTNNKVVLGAYLVVYFVWGSTFFFIHKALSDFTPFVLGSLRFFAASMILLTYCKMRGYKIFNKQVVKQACITGFLLLFIDMGALIWAEQHVSSGIAAIMAAAAALWFIILDRPQWKHNFSSLPIVLGLILGFVGVIMLFAEQITIAGDESQRLLNIFCMVLLILGSIAWTVGSLYSKYSKSKNEDKGEDLHVMVKTSWQMITAGILFTVVALLNGEYAQFDIYEISASGWFSLAYLITFGSILAFGSYIWLIQNRPVTEVSTYAYVNPVVAVALSYFFTDDIITSLQIGGLVVVLLSVGLMNWDLYKNSKFLKKVFSKKRSLDRQDNEQLHMSN